MKKKYMSSEDQSFLIGAISFGSIFIIPPTIVLSIPLVFISKTFTEIEQTFSYNNFR